MAINDHPFRIGFLVHDVARLRRTVFDKVLRTIGVTRSQWWVLAHLSRHDGAPMMQTELAKVMDLGKVTLGGLIDRLELAGLVERKPVPADRRAKLVVMTSRGVKLLDEMQRLATGVNSQILKGNTATEIANAETVLQNMKRQLLAMDAVPRTAVAPVKLQLQPKLRNPPPRERSRAARPRLGAGRRPDLA